MTSTATLWKNLRSSTNFKIQGWIECSETQLLQGYDKFRYRFNYRTNNCGDLLTTESFIVLLIIQQKKRGYPLAIDNYSSKTIQTK
ncbi:hypothetical protein BV372_24665 [Nostoc sp. T09]|nr:hypothetical protein BV372_24665 [Nostoc sp. T09]